MQKLIIGLSAFTALLGIFFAIEHFADSAHYNAGFDAYPLTIGAHVALGGVYLAFASVQFLPGLRRNHPMVHRWSGRIAIAAGLVSGLYAILVTLLFPFSGFAEFIGILPFGGLFLYGLVRGGIAARQKNFAKHRAWMVRAFAVATGIATMRLIFVPLLILLEPGEDLTKTLSLSSFVAAFLIHIAVAEYWLRRSRLSG